MEREQINHFTKPPDCLAILKSWRCRFSVSHPGIKQQTHRWRQNRAKVVQLVEPAARQEALITRVSCSSSVRRQQRTGGGLPCTIKQKYFHRIQETGEGRKKFKNQVLREASHRGRNSPVLAASAGLRGCGTAVADALVSCSETGAAAAGRIRSDLWHFSSGAASRSHTAGRSCTHFRRSGAFTTPSPSVWPEVPLQRRRSVALLQQLQIWERRFISA